ncbi:hypothetical protein D0Z07_3623 [Hyphodiscus hymeniophilus]|uniref:Uncharacterized protein n=1 Tax=Hyphodiscus hymeniophilus TaxID=353542 RepID=A0A9P7AXG2_9HELO|nr:hypothetical protein D0Z07_3623 [Hyphodiscus hymeniophilus]
MATDVFAALLLVIAIIVIYITKYNSQQWKIFSNCHTIPSTKQRQTTVVESTGLVHTTLKPFQLPTLKPRTSSHMAMGLKRLEESNWLTIDKGYHSEHVLRAYMLENARPDVLQCLPNTEAACHEVLDLVTSFLSKRFPECFTINHSTSTIFNHLTKESHLIGAQCSNPMEVAARLAMEDFNILVKDPQSGEYTLMASATLFPAGWQLQERIGTSMANLHSPVPRWQEKLGSAVNRYFDHLSPRTCMERYNLFIQTTNELFQDGPEAPPPLAVLLTAENITVRRERQTFTRLEQSGGVLFTVRTYMQPLIELGAEESEGLLSQIRGWDGEMQRYKGWDHWGTVVEQWCERQISQQRKDLYIVEDATLRERKLSV